MHTDEKFPWNPSWLKMENVLWGKRTSCEAHPGLTDFMLGLVKESELRTKFVTPCAHMALIGYQKRVTKFLITRMGEF